MNQLNWIGRLAIVCVLVPVMLSGIAVAQDDEDDKWYLTVEATAVSASGNTESMTYGLNSKLGFLFPSSEIKIEAGGILTESNLGTQFVVEGTTDLKRADDWERTAEAYFARGRYDFKFARFFLVFVGVDWLRNTFAGLDSRTLIALGLGNTWKDTEKLKFKTDYSGTYTFQEDVVEDPFFNTKFPGIRLSYDFWLKLSSVAEFDSELRFDINLDNSDDLRANWYNALPINITSVLAFKPSVALLWRNLPSLTTVPVWDTGGNPTGATQSVRLKELDTFFQLALVVKL